MKTKSLFFDALFCTILTFLVGGFLYFAFVNLSFLDPFENAFKDFKFTDIFYAERFNKEEQNNKIILVNVKHADRFTIAQAINKIAQQQPKVIGLDVLFKERKMAFSDSVLRQSLLQNKNIVTAYYHNKDSIVQNHPYFSIPNQTKGYINLNLKYQNSVIRDFLGVKSNPEAAYSFATQMAISSGKINKDYVLEELSQPLPINYLGNKAIFLNFNIEDIIASEPIPVLKDAYVLMGYLGDGNDAYDIEDKHFTPLNEAWVGRAVPDTFGVTIHANILNMLTQGRLIYRLPAFLIYVLAFVATFFMILFAMKLYIRNSFIFDLSEKIVQLIWAIILLYLALLFLQGNIYIDVVPLILLPILGIEMIDYYGYLMSYLKKKFKWESQFIS